MTNIHNTWRGSLAQACGAGSSGRTAGKMTPRRCSTPASVVLALAVALAPALTPAALAYDAEASRPADLAARFMLPDWDTLDGGIDPFRDTLIPRRAMEHPREFDWDLYDALGGLAGGYCYIGGWCSAGFVGGLVAYGVARAVSIIVSRPENKPDCTIYTTEPDCF